MIKDSAVCTFNKTSPPRPSSDGLNYCPNILNKDVVQPITTSPMQAASNPSPYITIYITSNTHLGTYKFPGTHHRSWDALIDTRTFYGFDIYFQMSMFYPFQNSSSRKDTGCISK